MNILDLMFSKQCSEYDFATTKTTTGVLFFPTINTVKLSCKLILNSHYHTVTVSSVSIEAAQKSNFHHHCGELVKLLVN